MKSFSGCIAIATETENGESSVQNRKSEGKRITQDEFIIWGQSIRSWKIFMTNGSC